MRAAVGSITLLLTACGSAEQTSQTDALTTMEVEAPSSAGAPVAPGIVSQGQSTTTSALKVAVPQMAYSYGYVFRLPQAAIAAAQAKHVALCDTLGPSRCQVLAMQSAGGDEDSGTWSLKLRVASDVARRFGAQLTDSVDKAGGRAVSATIAAEDVSKQIVDTEARLRQRELLVARLTEILRTRQGKVSELVEAERSVAAAQEEIDQARGWLAELRARVAMSTMDIGYQSVAPGPAAARGGLADSVAQSGSVFVAGLSAILQLVIMLAPWALLVGAIVWAARRFVPRLRRGRSAHDAVPE